MDLTQRALPGILTAGEARVVGIPRSRLRGPAYRRVAHGIYAPATVDETPDTRIAIVVKGLPDGAVVGGWAAARLLEREAAEGDDVVVFDGLLPSWQRTAVRQPILVCADPSARLAVTPGTRVFRSVVPPEERMVLDGTPMTSPARTAFDIARLWPRDAAVVALDRLRQLGAVDAAAVAQMLQERRRWRGVPAARRALILSDDGAESPRESMLRLLWMDAGLPRPLCNAVVVDRSRRFIARVDLLDPDVGLAGEYDGARHASSVRRRDDAVRQEKLEAVGIVVVRANEPDLGLPSGRAAWQERVRAAHRRARTNGSSGAWAVRPTTRPDPRRSRQVE